MKRTIRLPRSDEGGMLLDMPHTAYREAAFHLSNQGSAFSWPRFQLSKFLVMSAFV